MKWKFDESYHLFYFQVGDRNIKERITAFRPKLRFCVARHRKGKYWDEIVLGRDRATWGPLEPRRLWRKGKFGNIGNIEIGQGFNNASNNRKS